MFGLIKKIFIGLITKCVSLSNQKCMIQPLLLNYIVMNRIKNLSTINLR